MNDYIIQIKNMYKSYGENTVFENLNLSFKKNKIIGILGPSGCGKTTLLKIISGDEKIDKGEVLTKFKNISYVFQEDRLIPWLSVYENIAFVLKSYLKKELVEQKVLYYLNMVKLLKYKDKLPCVLSGGMKRRVALARAFAYDSSIILMDEPFKGLDLDLKNCIITEFKNMLKIEKKTVIIVTHDVEEANSMTDEIIYLKNND